MKVEGKLFRQRDSTFKRPEAGEGLAYHGTSMKRLYWKRNIASRNREPLGGCCRWKTWWLALSGKNMKKSGWVWDAFCKENTGHDE